MGELLAGLADSAAQALEELVQKDTAKFAGDGSGDGDVAAVPLRLPLVTWKELDLGGFATSVQLHTYAATPRGQTLDTTPADERPLTNCASFAVCRARQCRSRRPPPEETKTHSTKKQHGSRYAQDAAHDWLRAQDDDPDGFLHGGGFGRGGKGGQQQSKADSWRVWPRSAVFETGVARVVSLRGHRDDVDDAEADADADADGGEDGEDGGMAEPSFAARAGAAAARRSQKKHRDRDRGSATVVVVEGRGLLGLDDNGKSDPYVTLASSLGKARTKAVPQVTAAAQEKHWLW